MLLFSCSVSAGGIFTQSSLWIPSLHQAWSTLMESECLKKKDGIRSDCLNKLSQSLNIREQQTCIVLLLLLLLSQRRGIKRWNLAVVWCGVYSRQCRVRISSCYSSKHNNFMLTKTVTSSTHKIPSQGQERLKLAHLPAISPPTALTRATALALRLLMKCFFSLSLSSRLVIVALSA